MGIWYTTREKLQRAPDLKPTHRVKESIDGAIDGASRNVEGELHRFFYPRQATHRWDWPVGHFSSPWRLWFEEGGGEHLEAVSISEVVSGGITIPSTDYTLYPDDGPPYDRLELLTDASSIFGGGSTHQKDIALTGIWGFNDEQRSVGILGAAVADATVETINVTSGAIEVGHLLKIDTERMNVIDRQMLTTGQTLQGSVGDNRSDTVIPVQNGAAFTREVILVDGERMLVLDVAGNNLVVDRAWDGSVLTPHSAGATIYGAWKLTVGRGAVGSTAAAHSNGAAITRWVVPGLVENLCVAFSLDTVLQVDSGYARVVGSGRTLREEGGRGIKTIREDAYQRYGRKVRTRGV